MARRNGVDGARKGRAGSSVDLVALVVLDKLTGRRSALGPPLDLPPASSTIRSVVVCVITYRRPLQLARLLDSLARQRTSRILRVVVVDNDPDGSARDVTKGVDVDLTYVVEPRPGIPAARNACLDRVRDSDDAVMFIDDDEWAEPDWVDELCGEAERQGVHIVAGPVRGVLPDDAPGWIRRGGFFEAPVRPTGSIGGSPYTGNSMVTTALLRWSGTRFDEEGFAHSGGSDTDFFDNLALSRGVPWFWCAEAIVHESVPRERLSARWLLRRGVRGGNVMARMQLRWRPRWKVAGTGLASALAGALATPVAAIIRPRSTGAAVTILTRGVGMLGAVSGRLVLEYRRLPELASADGSTGVRSR